MPHSITIFASTKYKEVISGLQGIATFWNDRLLSTQHSSYDGIRGWGQQ